jgi:anti-sigma factor RsiW
MEHADIRRKLAAYLDNAVSDEEKEEIKRHLGRCGGCRGEIADLELTVRFLKSLPEVEPPPWLAEKIMANVRDEAAQKRSLWRRLFFPIHVKLPIEALAMLFLCVTGYYLTRMISEQPPVARAPEVPQKIQEKAPSHTESYPLPTSAASRPQAGGEQRKIDAPQSADIPLPPPAPNGTPIQKENAPHPAKPSPARKMVVPELRPTDDGLMSDFDKANPVFEEKPASAVKRGGKGQAEEALRDAEAPAAVSARKEEISLAVDDPVAATGPIEEAVTRFGGRINGHSYSGESHLLFIRINSPNYPRLLERLGRVGTIQQRPQLPPGTAGMIDLIIRW